MYIQDNETSEGRNCLAEQSSGEGESEGEEESNEIESDLPNCLSWFHPQKRACVRMISVWRDYFPMQIVRIIDNQ